MARRTLQFHEEDLAAYAEWEWHCAQLHSFVSAHGHGLLGAHPLGEWLRRQQQAALAGRLSAERQQRLAALGVSFEADDAAWDSMLKRVRDELRRAHLPSWKSRARWLPDPADGELAVWLREQRALDQEEMLPASRLRRLRQMKLLAGKRSCGQRPPASRITAAEARELRHAKLWETRLRELAAYKRRHGDCDVPPHWPESQPLANWVRAQRKSSHLGKMTDERRARLDALGFPWSNKGKQWDKLWERRFQEIVAFKAQHGHTRVPKGHDRPLWHWRHIQREYRRRSLLKPERIARLDAIGFEWVDPESSALTQQERWDRQWLRMHEQLVQFHREHGHCHVRKKWEGNPSLAEWVADQRSLKGQGKLRPERQARLDAIGFLWSTENIDREERWERRYAQLCAYQQQHGHTRVAKGQDRQLWHWRHVQREYRRKGLLKPERIARLDAIGFEWEEWGKPWAKSREERWELQWERMFTQLVEFQREHGTTHVTAGWAENPGLATWVGDQRERERHGGLRPDRKARLDALGFCWSPGQPSLEALWEQRYQQMCDFHQQHGHTRVAKGQDRQLWHWRHVQREYRRKGLLKPERIARLDAIGFEWEERRLPPASVAAAQRPSPQQIADARWAVQLERLITFQREHGHFRVPAQSAEHRQLSQWTSDQRKLRKRGKLSAGRIAQLDAIRFPWTPLAAKRPR